MTKEIERDADQACVQCGRTPKEIEERGHAEFCCRANQDENKIDALHFGKQDILNAIEDEFGTAGDELTQPELDALAERVRGELDAEPEAEKIGMLVRSHLRQLARCLHEAGDVEVSELEADEFHDSENCPKCRLCRHCGGINGSEECKDHKAFDCGAVDSPTEK